MSHIADCTASLTGNAKEIYQSITEKRGPLPGLFPMLMHYPELAEKFVDLSGFLRFAGSLPPNYREFTILSVGAELKMAYIFDTHLKFAHEAGLDGAVIQAIANGDGHFSDPLYTALRQFVRVLLQRKVMPQSLQDQITAKLGMESFMQLNVIVGMYQMIAAFVVAYEFQLPKNMTDPFKKET